MAQLLRSTALPNFILISSDSWLHESLPRDQLIEEADELSSPIAGLAKEGAHEDGGISQDEPARQQEREVHPVGKSCLVSLKLS